MKFILIRALSDTGQENHHGQVKRNIVIAVVVSSVIFLLALLGIQFNRTGGSLNPLLYPLIGLGLVGVAILSYSTHRKAIAGKRLSWLQELGLVVEQKGRYWGYRGVYKGYFVRLFVNPESRFLKRFGPDLCVMVYFAPMRRSDGKRDIALLRRIEQDLTDSIFDFRLVKWSSGAIHIVRFTPFRWFTRRASVLKQIDKTIAKVEEHGLHPWPEAEVERWVQRSPELHGPPIDYFQELFPEKVREVHDPQT